VTDFLDILEDFPEIGTTELAEKKIRGFQLTKQTRIFYRLKDDKIIILSFFDVRQNPGRKPI
jgi:plasmid stabilization system protein ParE